MDKVLDAHNSNRAAAFGTQIYQLLTLEYRVDNIFTYTEKQQKAPGANIADVIHVWNSLLMQCFQGWDEINLKHL